MKRLIVIGGPNGAGKTTFARYYLQEYPADFLSADDLAFKISPDRPELAKIEAYDRLHLSGITSSLCQPCAGACPEGWA